MKTIKTQDLTAGLYLIATPIGNLRDITLRALDTFSSSDHIICEDTRVTGKLLHAYDIKSNLIVYNDHSPDKQRDYIIEQIKQGKVMALVSDAGTPLVSDPGFKLVRQCLEEDLLVTVLPGANAPMSALQLSGIATNAFSFIGFLPSKSAGRQSELEKWKASPSSLILFESAKRLTHCLADCLKVLGDRQAAIVREITKLHEESKRGSLSDLLEFYEENGAPKGEIVIVIEAYSGVEYSDEDVVQMLKEALSSSQSGVKGAATQIAEQTGRPRKELYDMALKIKNES